MRYAISLQFGAFCRVLIKLSFIGALFLQATQALVQPIVLLSDDNPSQHISAVSWMWIGTLGAQSEFEPEPTGTGKQTTGLDTGCV